ncbi:glycosyltransferase [Microbulbifer taiwanensis]|uniref:Glycosyltransferase n=1 Tax=Microbulbifer taiwanensis TaxID=986746 RepID=A0ABW1YH11_9GAMM|nr:glycosyltransferase [Microbulbifer taiwanensis]
MKVVQILSGLDAGAVEKAALDFAHELVRLGHESIVISNGGELVPRLTLRGSRHIQMSLHRKSLWSLRQVSRLRRLLQELQADVVHVRSRMPAWITWLAWRGMAEGNRPRLVTCVHGQYSEILYSGVMASGERVIAASRGVADYLQARYGKRLRRPPQVIYRGVNTREFDRDAPISGQWQLRLLNDYPQLEGRHWLLMPARLAPDNGQGTFLQLLAVIARQRDDVFGLVVGGADPGMEKYARKLEQQALDLGLSDRVLFLGERRDMRELYASSQITYALPGRPEVVSPVAAEALAMDCPVVTYADGASAEILQQCFTAGLVERGNLEALVQASLQILECPQPVSFNGLSHEDTAAQTLAVYRELCQSA